MREKIQVWQENRRVLIRSRFSSEYDLVVELWHVTDENAWLITPDMPITDFDKGRQIHLGPDDFPASFPGEYGTLSGNHASPFARRLLVFDHGMGEKELGAIFTDINGSKYCLMEICDRDNLLIHPLKKGDDIHPDFADYRGEALFYNDRRISVIDVAPVQLYPSNRISCRKFLVDGKTPLAEKELTECEFLDHILDYDVVMPSALVDMVIAARGRAHLPEFTLNRTMTDLSGSKDDPAYDAYRKLPALLSYQLKMRHEAGACVSYRHVEVKSPLTSLEALDVMFIWSGEFAGAPVQEFYIPKVKPVTVTARDGQSEVMDFAGVVRFDREFPAVGHITAADAADPADTPDRFIRLSGNEKRRELGVAVGYSLINGLSSQPDWGKYRPRIYQFAPTWKMYPHSYYVENPPANWQTYTVAYRNYFDPAAEPDATSFYYHHENDDLLLTMDFHKNLAGKVIRLPAGCAGCTMEVVEKSPSLQIRECQLEGESFLTVDVTESYGYAVLRFSAAE